MLKKIIVLTLTAALFGGPVWAGQGRGQKQSNPQRKGPMATGQRGGQQQGGYSRGAGTQERKRVHVSRQQRDQLRNCTQSGEQVRRQARDMTQVGKGGRFDAPAARRQRDQLRTHVDQMLGQQGRFMQNLDAGQRNQLRDWSQKMDLTRNRLQTHFQALDEELGKENPNPETVRRRARNLEKELKKFEKDNRKLGEQLTVEP